MSEPVPVTTHLMGSKELQSWVLRRLGAPGLVVELTQDHLDDEVEMARRWFAAKKGVRRQKLIDMFSGVNQYTLDDDVDTVLDVAFPVPVMDISLVFSPYILQDEKVPYDVFAAPSTQGLYSSYVQTVQYVKDAKRILNAEADWRQEDRNLLIFPIPKISGQLRLDYKSHNFTIEQLHERDHDLFKRYCLAWAKQDLAHIRLKYQNFPGAQGSVMLDGERLLKESQIEIDQLDKEIGESAKPMGFFLG